MKKQTYSTYNHQCFYHNNLKIINNKLYVNWDKDKNIDYETFDISTFQIINIIYKIILKLPYQCQV